MKISWPRYSKKDIEANMLKAWSGGFGCATLIFASTIRFSDDRRREVGNSVFLPPAAELPGVESGAEVPGVESRVQVVTLTKERGHGFQNCESVRDLCICVLHSHIGASISDAVRLLY